jgi:hypothetical protein
MQVTATEEAAAHRFQLLSAATPRSHRSTPRLALRLSEIKMRQFEIERV